MRSARENVHSVLEIGRTAEGYVVRVEGRGSMHESPGLKAMVADALDAAPTAEFTIDLSECEYLDSTFLGCLVGLHSKFNTKGTCRLQVAGSDEKLGELFGPSGLERILPRDSTDHSAIGEWVSVPAAELDRNELGRHLIDSHRQLAEVGGPQAETFSAIADEIERELSPDRR